MALVSNVPYSGARRKPFQRGARAWNDAALALVELELPAWKLRRLVHENGKWHCSLSRHPNLPVALDDTATASHEVLPLAILIVPALMVTVLADTFPLTLNVPPLIVSAPLRVMFELALTVAPVSWTEPAPEPVN